MKQIILTLEIKHLISQKLVTVNDNEQKFQFRGVLKNDFPAKHN